MNNMVDDSWFRENVAADDGEEEKYILITSSPTDHSGRQIERYVGKESGSCLMYLWADTKELITGVVSWLADEHTLAADRVVLKNGKHHCVGEPAYIGDEFRARGARGEWYYLDGRSYVSTDLKQYWIECWEKYRTPENEQIIMAKLLGSKDE